MHLPRGPVVGRDELLAAVRLAGALVRGQKANAPSEGQFEEQLRPNGAVEGTEDGFLQIGRARDDGKYMNLLPLSPGRHICSG